jgi:hypothetical protein
MNPREPWEAPAARWLDGEPEPGDGELLADAVRRDPMLLRELSGLSALDDLLRQNADPTADGFADSLAERLAADTDRSFARRVEQSLPGRSPVRRSRYAAIGAVAAIAVGIGLSAFFLRGGRQPEVATVLLAEQCEWDEPSLVTEGERLAAGVLHLRQGLAVLRCDGGAELILRGDTRIALLSAGRARLVQGEVTVRAPEEAAGFKLLTPAGEMLDLGTEFAAKVETSGATELHVLEGEVAYGSAASGGGTVLGAGKAVRFDGPTTVTPREVAIDARRFDEILRAARPATRADLMLAYEGFSYRAGRLPFAEASGGLGWRGPWRDAGKHEAYREVEISLPDLNIVHDGTSFPRPLPNLQPGMLEVPPGTTSLARTLERPIALDKDGVCYFSFIVREPDAEADWQFGGVRLVFRSSADPADDMLSFGPTRKRVPGIRIGNGPNFTSPVVIAKNQNTLWIGKIIARRNGDDDVFFSVYGERDALDYAEPAVWQVATRGVQRDGRLDLVVIAGQLNAACAVDEIRIGPTWRSVAPVQTYTEAP